MGKQNLDRYNLYPQKFCFLFYNLKIYKKLHVNIIKLTLQYNFEFNDYILNNNHWYFAKFGG